MKIQTYLIIIILIIAGYCGYQYFMHPQKAMQAQEQVDDVQIQGTIANGQACGSNASCSSNQCENYVCVGSTGTACTSSSDCASNDCSGGVCTGASIGASCSAASDCATGNCTNGVCVGSDNGAACSGSYQCNSGNCSAGICTGCGHTGTACSADGNCCDDNCDLYVPNADGVETLTCGWNDLDTGLLTAGTALAAGGGTYLYNKYAKVATADGQTPLTQAQINAQMETDHQTFMNQRASDLSEGESQADIDILDLQNEATTATGKTLSETDSQVRDGVDGNIETNRNELSSEDLNSQLMAAEDHRHSHDHLEHAVKGENEEEIGVDLGDPEDRDPEETEEWLGACKDTASSSLEALSKWANSMYEYLTSLGWTEEEIWDYIKPYIQEAAEDAGIADA